MNRTHAAVVCISLANLCHLALWSGLFSADFSFYLRDSRAFGTALAGVLVSVAAMSLVGFGVFLAARTHPYLRNAARGACFVVLTIPVWTAISWLIPGLGQNISLHYLLSEFFAFGAVGMMWGYFPRFRRVTYSITGAAVLALPLFLAQAARLLSRLPRSTMQSAGLLSIDSSQQSAPAVLPGRPRLIWFLFDELDEYATFESKAGVPALPEFEKLRRSSFHATSAVPAAYLTLAAVPSMFLGQAIPLESAAASDGRDWMAPQGLFSILRKEGKSSAILGWYLPYCTLLHAEVTKCYSVLETAPSPLGVSWTTRTIRQWRQIGRSIPLFLTTYKFAHHLFLPDENIPSLDAARHKAAYDALHAKAAEFIAGPYDVIYVHWPVPHLPGIGAPRSVYARPAGDYLDNLSLADASLGEFRRTLQAAKLWDDSTIVVTGDHHYRANMWRASDGIPARVDRAIGGKEHPRVPVLIKLPHQTQETIYDKPFSALLMHDLMLGLANAKFSSPAELGSWLDVNRGRFPGLTVP